MTIKSNLCIDKTLFVYVFTLHKKHTQCIVKWPNNMNNDGKRQKRRNIDPSNDWIRNWFFVFTSFTAWDIFHQCYIIGLLKKRENTYSRSKIHSTYFRFRRIVVLACFIALFTRFQIPQFRLDDFNFDSFNLYHNMGCFSIFCPAYYPGNGKLKSWKLEFVNIHQYHHSHHYLLGVVYCFWVSFWQRISQLFAVCYWMYPKRNTSFYLSLQTPTS